MRSLLKYASSAVVLVALAASGCLKSDETITVYPDGSGKIQMKTTLLGMMAQMAKMGGPGGMGGGPGMGGPGGGQPQDPFELLKKNVGKNVYWTNLATEDGAQGEYTLSGTGYFEDVNQLNGKERQVSFKKDDAGDGYVFEMKGELPSELSGAGGEMGGKKGTPEQEQMQKQMADMMKSMMAGFDMKVKVVMPGAVKTATGLKAVEDGSREAVFALGEKDLQAIMDKKQEPPKEMRVVSKAADTKALETELATFKKELADAKASSQKEAADKKAAKKSVDGDKSDSDKKPAAGAKGDGKGDKSDGKGDKKDGKDAKKPQDF